MKKNLT